MFKYQISISINTGHNRDELLAEFESMLGSFCQSGQILKAYEVPCILDDEIVSFQKTLEKTSLSKNNNSEYVDQSIHKLERWCNSRLATKLVAIYSSSQETVCKCRISNFYVLFTHTFNELSPIACGTCEKVVPIYKLRTLTGGERYDILNWETNYKACDDLQLGCTVGERWATKQMSDPKSQLSKQGREVCRTLENATGVATYYYLFNYRNISLKNDKKKMCPSCDGKWVAGDNIDEFCNFKCTKCRLVSSYTSNAKS